MKTRSIPVGIAAALGMFILILDNRSALAGAAAGLELCVKTVIPALFPFIFLSRLLTLSLSGMDLPLLRPVRRLFSMPESTEFLLIPSFFGGYPVGAQSIAAARASGQLTRQDAENLLAFCNNPGPAFLFGMVGRFFPGSWMVWLLWAIVIFSALLVSSFFPCSTAAAQAEGKPAHRAPAMQNAVSVMACICGWVIVFRVLITFLDRWVLWLLPNTWRILLIGILELSNGCCDLSGIQSIPFRFVLAAGFLSFGGLCVTMQTVSLVEGLSVRRYFMGKSLQTLFSLLLAGSVFYRGFFLLTVVLLLLLIIPQKFRKRGSNPQLLGV